MELLAPAGSPECLEPAVRCGADAVYLGASRFSARGNAANFDREALANAVRYCHGRGVKVYLALNTLLRDDELEDALALVQEACALHVDALIVQDPGLIRMIRACAPDMKLSASTQMSIHAPAGVALCRKLGMGRVVLSRELSKTELQELGKTCGDMELEALPQGAWCMS
jgi:putative protease